MKTNLDTDNISDRNAYQHGLQNDVNNTVCRDFDIGINKWTENNRIKELNICLIYGIQEFNAMPF